MLHSRVDSLSYPQTLYLAENACPRDERSSFL
jgi:hypothetical protein